MEEQKINKKITFSIVAVLLIVLITIGATYAYFSAQGTTGTQTVTTGTLTMNFDKAGSVVTINGITPIDDSEIKTKAAAFPFSITNTGTAHMNITIKLKDIVIADDLKDVDFRWGLYNTDSGNGVSFGIFKNTVTGGEEILIKDVIIDSTDPDSTKNYTLRIWIHDDGANQNYMQGETFSGKIDVTGEAVDYTPESCFEGNGSMIEYYYKSICGNDIVIPKTIRNQESTGLYYIEASSGIIIPDTVTSIHHNTFTGAESITIPESVTSLNLSSGAPSNYFLPETVTVFGIGSGMIQGDIVIPGSVKTVNTITNTGEIILMNGIETLNTNYSSNGYITSLEIPSSVKTVSEGAFAMFSKLTEVVIRGKSSLADFTDSTGLTAAGRLPEGVNIVFRP